MPVVVPGVGVVEAAQGHDGLGVVVVPVHAAALEAGGERAAERFRRAAAGVVGSINVLGKGIEPLAQNGAFHQEANFGKLPISLAFPKTLMLPVS